MREEETGSSLLRRATSGSQKGWREFQEFYSPFIQGRLQGIHHLSPERVEALTHDIMAHVHRYLRTFDYDRRTGPGAFRAWLRKITRQHVSKDARRQKRRRRETLKRPIEEIAKADNQLIQEWDREYHRYVVGRLLDMVAPRFQETTLQVFRMAWFDEKKNKEIAAELGMAVGAVATAKFRVLQALKEVGEGLIDPRAETWT